MAAPFSGDALPTLDTPRLLLRHVRAEDVPSLFVVFSDAEAMRYWSHGPMADLAEAEAYRRQIEEGFASRTLFQWVVADREADGLLGTVTLYAWSREHRRVEVGYMLGRAHWGQGLAQEAVGRALRFAFGPMNVHRVEADVHPGNAASLRLLARLGFKEEGRLAERWFTFGEWSGSVMLGLLSRDFDTASSAETDRPRPAAPDPFADGLPALDTSRLHLRALTAADDDAIVVLFSDRRALETWTVPPFASRADAEAYRADLAGGLRRRALFVWGVFVRDGAGEGLLAGVALLTRWAPIHRRVDLGYYLASRWWGRGLATEAAGAVMAFAFDTLGVHRVEAEVVPENRASARVLERLGFRHEATLRERLWGGADRPEDSLLHVRFRPDFEAARAAPPAR